jgi:site-specific recombinase XerD
MWPHKALQTVWRAALKRAEPRAISFFEGTEHSFATDAIRRGVSERHLQRFLGHSSVVSTRRYARLADNAMLKVMRPEHKGERQVGPPGFEPGSLRL